MIDRSKYDVRVFFIPQNNSVLAHYLAMYDDLYCQNIYNFFSQNTLLSLFHKVEYKTGSQSAPEEYAKLIDSLWKSSSRAPNQCLHLQSNLAVQLIDRAMQCYLRDAIRNVEIKIFKADIKYKADGVARRITVHFVSRLELGYSGTLGNVSIYDKMDSVKKILNATSKQDCKLAFEAMQRQFPDGIDEIDNEINNPNQASKAE